MYNRSGFFYVIWYGITQKKIPVIIRISTILFIVLFAAACTRIPKTTSAVEIDGCRFRLENLPSGDSTKLAYRFNIQAPGKYGDAAEKLSMWPADSMFYAVENGQKIPAMHVSRVANGNLGGMEFYLLFPKGRYSEVVFKDAAFTKQLVTVPTH